MDNKKRVKTLEAFRQHSPGLAVLFCTDLAARGLDIPNVDWIIQYDPPLDPDFFVHRVGRTARAGTKGKALVFLTPHESQYPEFLRARKVPIVDLVSAMLMPEVNETEVASLCTCLRSMAAADRDVLEKGVRAFVSHARAYREHRCRHIFKMSDVNFSRLAKAFALLRLPKMPELKNVKVHGFKNESQAVVDAVPYLNKGREKQRQANLIRMKQKLAAGKHDKAKGKQWQNKRSQKSSSTAGQKQLHQKRKRKGQHQRLMEEWESLAKEERLYKKLKRGKITKAEYDRLMGE